MLAACSGAGPGASGKTVAFIPNYEAGGGTASATPQGYSSADATDHGRPGRDRRHPHVHRPFPVVRHAGPGLVHRDQLRDRDA